MPQMHQDEIASSADLVRRLIGEQQPQWAHLPIERVTSTGTSNALYRLGEEMVVRLPLRPSSVKPAEKEHRWLALLAPQLPLPICVPLAKGEPTEEYPWPWSVYPWFEGQDATVATVDLDQTAGDLAKFLRTLHSLDATGGPEPSVANFGRGVPLAQRDGYTRKAIAASQGLVDIEAVTAAWEVALTIPAWEKPPRWIHGDVAAGNLLFRGGQLSAVIDWGALGIGDPACDAVVAWELFDAGSREVFRLELGFDDPTWERGRGWALSTAMLALPYYQHTNPFMAAQARRKIAAVLGEP